MNRIQKLVIPPAWQRVWISPDPKSHLQATGYDSKNRKQYLYHAHWHAVRNQTKFHRLARFGRVLPKIRRRVNRDLRQPGLPRDKVIAAVIRLLEHTRIRVGNARYADENKSYGLSTMRNHHATVKGTRVEFSFRGKSGKFHKISLFDARVARVVRRCQDLPGHQLFEYSDDLGQVHKVTSGDINDYLHAIAGEDFSAKDFRTWTATIMAARLLDFFEPDRKKPSESRVAAVVEKVAEALGNTRAVCRKFYIHPAILDTSPASVRKPAPGRAETQPSAGSSLERLLVGFLRKARHDTALLARHPIIAMLIPIHKP